MWLSTMSTIKHMPRLCSAVERCTRSSLTAGSMFATFLAETRFALTLTKVRPCADSIAFCKDARPWLSSKVPMLRKYESQNRS